MKTGPRMVLATLLLFVTSCSDRPENPDYFTKVTGLRLCSGATIRNVNANAPDRSPGFDSIYIVDVTMPASCEGTFMKTVSDRIHSACDPAKICSGNASNGDFYQVQLIDGALRVIHST